MRQQGRGTDMASLDRMNTAVAANSKKNPDVEIAVRMAIQMVEQGGGVKVIADALKSKDPAQVIGQFLAQLMGQLAEKMQSELDISPKIFLSKGGWLEKMLDYIERALNKPPEFSDEIYAQVLETVKAAAMGGNPPQEQAPPQEAMPQQGGMPQEGMVPQGGLGG